MTAYPEANLVRIVLDGGVRLQVRPSGTEPKVKLYGEAVDLDCQVEADAGVPGRDRDVVGVGGLGGEDGVPVHATKRYSADVGEVLAEVTDAARIKPLGAWPYIGLVKAPMDWLLGLLALVGISAAICLLISLAPSARGCRSP